MSKLFVVAALGWAALSCAAAAADLPLHTSPTVPPPVVPSAFTWTGFYVGANAGYASDRSRMGGLTGIFSPYLGAEQAYRLSGSSEGFTGGGQLGYNHQFGAGSGVVIGIEADFAYADLAQDRALPGGSASGLTASYRSTLDGIGTVRARAGYGFGPLLIYGTGGFAYGVSDKQAVLTGPNGATVLRLDLRDLDTGYAVGGGVEYALPAAFTPAFLGTGATTLRAEYLHVDIGENTAPLTVGSQAFTAHLRNAADIGRAGINYKF